MPDFMVRQIQTLKPDQKSNINATRGGVLSQLEMHKNTQMLIFDKKNNKNAKKKSQKMAPGLRKSFRNMTQRCAEKKIAKIRKKC